MLRAQKFDRISAEDRIQNYESNYYEEEPDTLMTEEPEQLITESKYMKPLLFNTRRRNSSSSRDDYADSPSFQDSLPPRNSLADFTGPLPSVPAPQTSDNNWITVFGFPALEINTVLAMFKTFGNVKRFKSTPHSTYFNIEYEKPVSKQAALAENGKFMQSGWVLGVISSDPPADSPALASKSLKPLSTFSPRTPLKQSDATPVSTPRNARASPFTPSKHAASVTTPFRMPSATKIQCVTRDRPVEVNEQKERIDIFESKESNGGWWDWLMNLVGGW